MRFPRDWLGPLDELVPLGPSAGQDSDREPVNEAPPAPPTPTEGRVVDFTPPAPLRAEDFWGEDSAAIHDALEPPAQSAAAAAAVTDADRPHSRRIDALRRHVPPVPRRIGHRVVSSHNERSRRRRAAPLAVISALAVAIIGAALAVGALRGGTSAPQPAARGDARGFTSTVFAALPSDVTAVARLGRRRLRAITPARPRIRRVHRPAPARHPRAASSHPSPPAPVVSTSRPKVYVQTPQAAPPTPTRVTPTVVQTQRPTTTSSSAGGGSTRSTAPATSSKRPAFGANGLLGPGSSPNS